MSNTITGSTPGYGAEAGASGSILAGTNKIANQEVFMKLLVEQLKNQDPLNPMDGTQFVSQLAQFSELEQVIQIRQDLGQLVQGPAAAGGGSEGK